MYQDEYIADMFSHEEDGPEPDWALSEREQFNEFWDLNKDGKLDKDEIRHWILPQDYDHARAEARHLVYESDKNKDEKLTKEEILDNWNMCVGSQATNYGEDLTKNHDELWCTLTMICQTVVGFLLLSWIITTIVSAVLSPRKGSLSPQIGVKIIFYSIFAGK